ncbi:kelch-like protein diablo [Paramacrobiotus metropolitanus]|uniref:kelch-like protein diablo n=1 Tax=Paramacrobiotus metropolitanus TaxID=2943436 RepID=UPI0024462F6B|nr:kelch-like protein diablo [Paramacrobiotus metropolitanus]
MSSDHMQPSTDSATVRPSVCSSVVQGFLDGLQDLKSSGVLCDVILKGAEDSAAGIPCHRVVLSAHSSYFRSMFSTDWKESSQAEIPLQNISFATLLNKLVTYAYTLQICLDDDTVESVLVAALFLDFSPVAKLCWDFLESRLDASSCLLVYSLAQTHNNPYLANKAEVLVCQHFVKIAHGVDFLQLDAEKVTELTASDDLCVEHEDEVLEAVKRWFDHDQTGRTAKLPNVLQYIRVPFLSVKRLENYFLALFNGLVSTGAVNFPLQSRTLDQLPGLPKVIVCVGGVEFDTDVSSVEVFCPSISAAWRMERPQLPRAVYGCGIAVMKDSLIICGGVKIDGSPTNQVSRLDLFGNECADLAPMLANRACGGVAALNGRVYAVGGCNDKGEVLTAAECYDPEKNVWQPVAGLPLPLAGFAIVATNDRLYVFGGMTKSDGYSSTHSAFCYDPAADAWNKLADMPTAREDCTACVGANGIIYVISGYSSDRRVRRVEAYEINYDQWSKKGDTISGHCRAGCAYMDGKIYVLGGGNDDNRDIEFYDEGLDVWRIHPCRLSKPNHSFGCTVMTMKKGTNWTGQIVSDQRRGQE